MVRLFNAIGGAELEAPFGQLRGYVWAARAARLAEGRYLSMRKSCSESKRRLEFFSDWLSID